MKKKKCYFLPKNFYIHTNKANFGGKKSGKYKIFALFLHKIW